MAPKAKGKASKAQAAKKEKVASDLTFGLKNKNKSKKVQKFVQQVQTQTQQNKGGQTAEYQKAQAEKNAKKAQQQQAQLMAALFKSAGGDKKKTDAEPPMNLYKDPRGDKYIIAAVCEHFLQACEEDRYNRQWKCENSGDKCAFRHALDAGYVLKKDRGSDEESSEDGDIAEKVDARLKKLKDAINEDGTTNVTEETFQVWKAKVMKEREENLKKLMAEDQKKKKKKKTKEEDTGREKSSVTGKELFTLNPDIFTDDDAAMNEDAYAEDKEYQDMLLAEADAEQRAALEVERKLLNADALVDEALFAEEGDLDDLDLE